MKKVKVILSIFFAVFALNSCSDDSTNPSNPDYFPLLVGNYWVYEQYTLDSTNTKVAGSKITDSAHVVSTQNENVLTMSGVTTYKTKHTLSVGLPTEQRNYKDDNAIYQYFDQIPGLGFNLFGQNLSDLFPVDWVKLIDFKNPTWTILPADTITIPELTLSGFRVSVKIIFNITGSKGSTKSFTVGSKNINTQDYTLSINITGEAKSLDIPLLPAIPLTAFSIPTHYYLADGIGLVSMKTESSTIKISTYFNQTLPGSESTLIRYNIVK
jgi:hypothetical protein